MWPAPLPYPQPAKPGVSGSERFRLRRRRVLGAQGLANLYFGVCSFLAPGSPHKEVSGSGPEDSSFSDVQVAALKRYERGCERLARLGALPRTGGRKALADKLAILEVRKYGGPAFRPSGCPPPLKADEFDFPDVAERIRLEDFNDGLFLDMLQLPSEYVREAPSTGAMPHAFMPKPATEWVTYVKMVDAGQGLTVLGAEDVARCPDGGPLLAGFFPVAKTVTPGAPPPSRGIMDRRPQNALEFQLPTPTLPHGTQLGLIILEPHEGFCITLRDLSIFL